MKNNGKSYPKGGLSKKIKGYADGGLTKDQKYGLAANGLNSAVDLGNSIANYKNATTDQVDPNNPQYIQQTKNAELGTGIGSAAGTGLGIGVAALTGGAATPLIPAFTAAGKLAGKAIGNRFDNKNSQNKFQSDTDAANKAQADAEMRDKFNSSLAAQLASRNTFKNGGKVEGKGTSKSDSIIAKVRPGSFIVPAENAKKAAMIRKHVLGESENSKADLKEDNGIAVKLSNGEHKFTPEEVEEIESYGIDLDDLAPNAEHGDKEMSKGGLTAEKAKVILHDGSIRGKKITDKQRRFFGAVSNGYKCGGNIAEYAEGGEVNPPTEKEINAILKGKSEQDSKRMQSLLKAKERALADKNPDNKYYNEALLKNIDEQLSSLSKMGVKAPDTKLDRSNTSTYQKGLEKKLGVTMPKTSNVSPVTYPEPKSTSSKLAQKVNPTFAQASLNNNMANQAADDQVTPPSASVQSGLANKVNAYAPKNAIDEDAAFQTELAQREAETAPSTASKNNYKAIGDGLSALVNYGVPIAQTALGARFLKKAGPRPVDNIDPSYYTVLNNANQRATYGYSPEELNAINNNNNNLTSAQRFAARNYSGGSAGNAYAMERAALNDSFGRGLATQASNRQLQLQKRKEADDIALQKVELSRRLFNDKLNGWNQNQQAGSALLGAGLSNLVGASRYQQEKKAIENQNAIANSWLNP